MNPDLAAQTPMPAQTQDSCGPESLILQKVNDAGTSAMMMFEPAQIDAVIDPATGNAVLLHAAQQALRETAAALQESERFARATIDALLQHIAVVDAAGRILAVNRVWRDFTGIHPDAAVSLSEGENYLEACDKAAAEGKRDCAAIAELIRAVVSGERDTATMEYACHTTAGQCWFSLRITRFSDEGPARIVIAHDDISERKNAEQRLQQLAQFDPLTGLPNRTLFYELLAKALVHATESNWVIGVMMLDLDRFKNINDTLGHGLGDLLLREFGDRVLHCLRSRDTVARLGGDEFALILLLPEGDLGAPVIASKIREALLEPFILEGHAVYVTASIGITFFPGDASDPETLLKFADTALYQAKDAGRDTYRFFTAAMNIQSRARLNLEIALRRAIDNEEFLLHYQPKVQVNTGRIVGAEALIRWNRPGHGMVPPVEFIPLLEETGLIVPVGTWVIGAACRQIAAWMRSSVGPLCISVNVSSRQFVNEDLEEKIVAALQQSGIKPELLELEITESSLMSNGERTITILRNLKGLGVKLSIDDFGTGYSSLSYLKRFPLDRLKIDIAFIREITTNPDDAAIALATISMAHSLKLRVVAEGVETESQLAYLRRHLCDEIQGYYFSRPVPPEEFEHMLLQGKRLPKALESGLPQRQTLLILDDEPNVLASLQRMVRRDGYHTLKAQTPDEAFELLALHRVQVIMCDQRMPRMSGTEFLSKVKDLYPDTIRIVLSGYTELESILDAVNRGSVYRFYTKPWDDEVLCSNIREAFQHHWLLYGAAEADKAGALKGGDGC